MINSFNVLPLFFRVISIDIKNETQAIESGELPADYMNMAENYEDDYQEEEYSDEEYSADEESEEEVADDLDLYEE